MNCRYNLRGLSPEGLCPECGHPILQSIVEEGGEPPASLVYRSMRLLLIVSTASVWGLAFMSASVRSALVNQVTGGMPSSMIYGLAGEFFLVPFAECLGLLAFSSRARRDRVVWVCLFGVILGAVFLPALATASVG